ncbi:hypothetical protein RYH80_09390 [Halobaculum sp. MBLA0147]|uniref:hypothetical protein n=1 Tax=Halobaculum sp. MBLA0147 TaxID=3079934 RepID=UPI0035252F5C
MNELQAPDRADKKLGVEAGKGTMGALGGVAGGVIGTALAPGVGTVAGQAVGTVVGGALGGAAGAVYERNFDDATAAVNQQVDDTRSYLDQLIEEKLKSIFGSDYQTRDTQGVGEGGNV